MINFVIRSITFITWSYSRWDQEDELLQHMDDWRECNLPYWYLSPTSGTAHHPAWPLGGLGCEERWKQDHHRVRKERTRSQVVPVDSCNVTQRILSVFTTQNDHNRITTAQLSRTYLHKQVWQYTQDYTGLSTAEPQIKCQGPRNLGAINSQKLDQTSKSSFGRLSRPVMHTAVSSLSTQLKSGRFVRSLQCFCYFFPWSVHSDRTVHHNQPF